ncbi:hypothetical protein SLA2020_046350 [Shorea laevis]
MVRTPSCDKNGLRKGTWTPEEDRKLIAYVTRYGCWNWRQLPKFAGLARCGKSCRLRWMNYLRPNVKRGNYTEEEEETIIRLHESLGNKWSAIAANLPGRTDNEIKNYWHTNLKKLVKQKRSMDDQGKVEIQSKTNTKEKEANTNNYHLLNPTTPPILESLASSPQPSSIDQQSTLTSGNATATEKDLDMISEEDINALLGEYEAQSGDFWTELFLADNSYMTNECLAPIVNSGYGPPLFVGEMFCSQYHGFYDDPIEGLLGQL